LDDRPVDDGQHFLRDGLGGRKEPRAEAGDRKNCLANALHADTPAFRPIIRSATRSAIPPEIFMPEFHFHAGIHFHAGMLD
jgi:hypothetical protein